MQIARECIVELTERDLLPDTVDLRTNHCGLRGMGFGTRNRRRWWWLWLGWFQLGQERSPWHQQRECGEKNSSVHMGGKVSTKRRKISTNFTKYEEEVGVSRVSGFWVFPRKLSGA